MAHPQHLAIFSILAVGSFSTEVYTLSLVGCCSRRNSEYPKTKKQPPTDSLRFTCRQLYYKLLTSNHISRNRVTVLMRCAGASGAPDRSRRQPETTHEVFRELEVASQRHKKLSKSLNITSHAPEPSTMATSLMKKCFHQNIGGLLAIY